MEYGPVDLDAVNRLLARHHYLGPAKQGKAFGMFRGGRLVAAQVYRHPSSRHIPPGVLELSRWVLTPIAGTNAGSLLHSRAVKWLKAERAADMLLSYSDPSAGHRGELYRASNWLWAPTWHRLRPPPSGLGSWDGVKKQAVKDRWVYPLVRNPSQRDAFKAKDRAAVRAYLQSDEYATVTCRWRTLVPWDEQDA